MREGNQWTNTPAPIFWAHLSGRCSVSFFQGPERTEHSLSPVTSTTHPSPLLPHSCTLDHLANKPNHQFPRVQLWGEPKVRPGMLLEELAEGKASYGEKTSERFCNRPRKYHSPRTCCSTEKQQQRQPVTKATLTGLLRAGIHPDSVLPLPQASLWTLYYFLDLWSWKPRLREMHSFL